MYFTSTMFLQGPWRLEASKFVLNKSDLSFNKINKSKILFTVLEV